MTPELLQKIEEASTMAEIEDIYLPFRPKRRTRATIAREKGLEPLAALIFEQTGMDLRLKSEEFVNEQVPSVEDAVAGASDIIAEWISEDEKARKSMRLLYEREAVIFSKVIKGKEAEGIKFSDYYEWSELLRKCPSHRLLAMLRGGGRISETIPEPEEGNAHDLLESIFIKSENESSEVVAAALKDS